MEHCLSEPPTLGLGGQRRSYRLQGSLAARRNSKDISASASSGPDGRSSRSTPAVQSSRSTPEEHSSRNTPQESSNKGSEGPSPSNRYKCGEPEDPDSNTMETAARLSTGKERRRISEDCEYSDIIQDSIDERDGHSTPNVMSGLKRKQRELKEPDNALTKATTHSSRGTPQKSADKGRNEIPSKRSVLRRKREELKEPEVNVMQAAMKPLTDEERRIWPGWVELESDPTLFNYILREYGAKDVKVQELFGLEDEALNFLPKPVYGLIFLFRYWDDSSEEDEEPLKCPNYVWFANQTITNACATIALLNIVMNVPEIDLGDNLSALKAETKGLKPPYRGHTLGENEFIRNIHNSFARRMDMLNADLALSNDYERWVKAKGGKKKKAPVKRAQTKPTSKKKKKNNNNEEPGFHFIAYVPINGDVWRLDGMQRQPVNLGEANNNWIELARENINLRIAQYDSELQFNLMALCRSPLCSVPEQLAENLQSLSGVEKALNETLPDWKAFVDINEAPLSKEPNEYFAISKELFVNSSASDAVQRKLKVSTNDPSMLLEMRAELANEQNQLQKCFLEEIANIGMENEQAARRKIDYSPLVYNSIKQLAEQGTLKDIIRDLIDKGQMKL